MSKARWFATCVSTIVIMGGLPVLADGPVLFEDDFETGVLDAAVWEAWGSPLPLVVTPGRDSSFSLDTRGDANFDSGAQTFDTFPLQGATLSFDVIVPQTFGFYQDTAVGIATDTLWVGGPAGAFLPLGWIRARGDLNSFRVEYALFLDSYGGTTETFSEPSDSAWHRFSMSFTEAGNVKFYRDGTLAFTSTQTIDYTTFPSQRIMISGRSQSSAPVLVDNVQFASCANAARARLELSNLKPAPGSQVTACVHVDLSNTGQSLGSYGATMNFDTVDLEFVSDHGGDPPFDSPVTNTDDAAAGTISFAQADPAGSSGDSHVACFEFLVVGAVESEVSVDLELTSLFAADTFDDLLAGTCVEDATLTVVEQCLIGDVNDEGLINSGDALLVLANEAALPIPAVPTGKIIDGCGDANGDGSTDSIDANVELSWEVGLPIDPAFPIGGTNVRTDDCADMTTAKAAIARRPADNRVVQFVGKRYLGNSMYEVQVVLNSEFVRLGSFGGYLSWDTSGWEIVSVKGGRSEGWQSPIVNSHEVNRGVLRFAAASPAGGIGEMEVLRLQVRALNRVSWNDPFRLSFTSLGGVAPYFVNLLPGLHQVESREVSRRGR